MVKITFPDGSVREYENGVTGYQIAESISSRLAQDVLAISVNGETRDLNRAINEDAAIKLFKFEDEEGKHTFWHTSAHLMAQAIQMLYPNAKFGIGPAIENGFYYDIDFGDITLKESDFAAIEKKMMEIVATKQTLTRVDISKADAMKMFEQRGEVYKTELISELEDGKITLYEQGSFTDLCRGPHLKDVSPIKAVKITSLAGAYWRGDEKRKQLTRLYAITFPKKKMLDEYLELLEEAKKRDHRKIGKEMELFMFTDMVGKGHPDLGALKRFFESRESYEAETFVVDKFNGNPLDYSLFVLHQLPDNNAAHNALVDKVLKSQVPALFVLGQQTAYERFDRLQMGLTLNAKGSRMDEATASVNGNFGSFSTDDGIRQVESFPPLSVPFGNIATATSTQTLLYAKIGNIVTNRPLVAFGQKNGIRYGFVVGDGLWRWPLADYQQNGSSEAFGTFLDKTCTYLAQQSAKEKFVVRAEAAFAENEVITLDAELYNDNFELVNSPEVSLSVADEKGTSRNFAFARTQNAYIAAIGTLPQGRYTYNAKTFFNGKKYHKNGTFAVQKNDIEEHNLTADHSLLNTIAQNSGGQMLYPQQLSQLPELLKNRDDIRNVMFSRYKYSELIKLPWLFVAIVLLL